VAAFTDVLDDTKYVLDVPNIGMVCNVLFGKSSARINPIIRLGYPYPYFNIGMTIEMARLVA
jgi:hypothetical protein